MIVAVQEGIDLDGCARGRVVGENVHRQRGHQTSGRQEAEDQETGTVASWLTIQGSDSLESSSRAQ